jgi:Tfp pilus assembly protein PilF
MLSSVQSADIQKINPWFRWIACGILVAGGVLLYGYTLSFPFVFDDHVYLVENPLIKDSRSFAFMQDFSTFATTSARMGLDPDLSTNFILRPVSYLTFHLNYAADGMRPRGYRAVNIVIHCLNAVLLFQILWHVLRASPKRGDLSIVSVGFIALGSALLFLVHPLQTESITYVVQRFTSLGALFYLVTIWTYLLANAATSPKAAWLWRDGSIGALVLGMLSKEEVFTAPLLLIVLDWVVMGASLKTVGKRAVPYLLCLPIIPVMIALTSHAQNSGNLSLTGAVNIVNPYNYAPLHYALTQLSVVLWYLRLVLFPAGLNIDWEYPLSTSVLQGRVLISIAVIVALVAGSAFWCWRRRTDVRVSLVFVSVLWYFTTLAISSSVVPLPDLMCEHRCYVATIGALCALVCCADMLRSRFGVVVPVVVAVWVVALSVATVARNQLWRSELTIWGDAAAKSPHKGRIWGNLGVAYYEHGQTQQAVSCLQKAVQVEPYLIQSYQNLGKIFNSQSKYQEALVISQLGASRSRPYEELHFNMGVAYAGLGQTANSIESFTRAVAIRPTHVPSHLCLAELHARLQQHDAARKHFETAAAIGTSNPAIQEAMRRIEQMLPRRAPVLSLNLR